jgi:hypothetical protein
MFSMSLDKEFIAASKEFLAASKELKEGHDSYRPEVWRSYRQNTWIFDNSSAWSFLYEIIQNAVDVHATAIRINLENDGTLVVQHNGTELLNSAAIQGLCGFSLSTKGLNGIGFMGIGFKSFLGFFSRVNIYDKKTRFKIEAPRPENSDKPNIKKLFFPEWIDAEFDMDEGMTTTFRFEMPNKGNTNKFEEAFESFNPLWLAVFGKRGLSTFVIQEKKYEFLEQTEGVKIELQDEDNNQAWSYMILEKNVTFDERATQELKERRDMEDLPQKSVERAVRLIKELVISEELSDEGPIKRIRPKEMKNGEMFCLVPLGDKFPFPFNIGIDSDWIIDPTRTKLVQETSGGVWHKTLLSSLPDLLKRYFDLLPPEMSPSDRKACLDIFPKTQEVIPDALRYLKSDEFYDSLKKSLSDSKFILCTDGTLRSPFEVKDIPKKPEGMSDEYYDKFTQNCFTCPLVDRTSISNATRNYLFGNLGFMDWPSDEEIITEQVQEMWDKSNNYLHMLDILDEIILHEEENEEGESVAIQNEHGPKVIPGSKKGVWISFRSPMMAFMPLPKSGAKVLEKPLYDILTERYPEIKNVNEIDEKLHDTKIANTPGTKWRKNAFPLRLEITSKIKSLEIPTNEANVIAVYRYALRLNKPEFVKYLHTPSGCKRKEKCLIGPPYGHEMMKKIAPDLVVSEIIKNASQGYSHEEVLTFLKNVGAVSLVPTEETEYNLSKDEARVFIGIEPNYSTKAYTAQDYIWPIPLSECSPKEFSNYLDDVTNNEELRKAIKQANKKKKLLSYYYQWNTQTNKKKASWLENLYESPWVPCADGIFRKPIECKVAALDEEKNGKHTLLSDISIQFFKNEVKLVFGKNLPDDDEARIEFWKKNLATNDLSEFVKTLKRLQENGKAQSMLADILDVKWEIRKQNKSAPLRRFLDGPTDDYGGFFGDWLNLEKKIREFFQAAGYQPEFSITTDLAKEYVDSVAAEDNEEITPDIFKNLRNANSIICETIYDFTGYSFYTYNRQWITINPDEHYYVQLSHDPLSMFEEMKHRILHPNQFPSIIETIRGLYDISLQFELIDNHADILSDMSKNDLKTVNMLRVIRSLKLENVSIVYLDETDIDLEIEDCELKAYYLIKDENEQIEIILSANHKRWAGPISKFLCEQSGISDEDVVEKIRTCLQSDHSEFEEVYSQLSNNGLKLYDADNSSRQQLISEVEDDSAETQNESRKRGGSEVTEESTTEPKQRPKIVDPLAQIATVPKVEQEQEQKRPNRDKKAKDSEKSEERRIDIKGNPEKDAERKETGKVAETLVRKNLTKMGWEALSWNDEFNEERVGHDLVFKKDNEIRVIEVKGHKGDWKGSQNISEAQLRMGLNYHGESAENHPNCKYSIWLYVVDNVYDDEPKIYPINWGEQKISAYFPRAVWFPNPEK